MKKGHKQQFIGSKKFPGILFEDDFWVIRLFLLFGSFLSVVSFSLPLWAKMVVLVVVCLTPIVFLISMDLPQRRGEEQMYSFRLALVFRLRSIF